MLNHEQKLTVISNKLNIPVETLQGIFLSYIGLCCFNLVYDKHDSNLLCDLNLVEGKVKLSNISNDIIFGKINIKDIEALINE